MKLIKRMVISAAVVITAAGVTLTADANPNGPDPTRPPINSSMSSGTFVNRVGINPMEPKSMTSLSTRGLFGNDVDDFMNVNEYGNVMPKNVFGYLGYGDDGASAINFGFAHQFKKLYLGGWFGGQINGWSITNTRKESNPDSDTTVSKNDTQNAVHGKVLFGIGSMGILANFSFKPGVSNDYTDDRNNKIKTAANQFALNASVKFGINHHGAKGRFYKTWAEAGLFSQVAKKEIKKEGKISSMVDQSRYTIALKGGSSFDVYNANDITQTIDIEAGSDFILSPTVYFKAEQGTVKQSGLFGMNIALTPAWTLAYEPEESKIAVKTKAQLKGKVSYAQDYDKLSGPESLLGTGGSVYNPAREYGTTLTFTPGLAVGLVYKAVPSKFSVNAGGEFSVPSVSYTHTKTENRESSTGKILTKDVTDTVKFNTADGKLGLTTGFTWTPSEKVTVDANWNILQFGNTSVNSIVNQAFAFLVSVKL